MMTVEIEAGGHWYLVTGVYSKKQAEQKFKASFMETQEVPEINTVKVYSEATVWFLR